MVRVKICGINDAASYEAAAAADWVGFVFFPPSPRFVTPAQAAHIRPASGPPSVGLFVEPRDSDVAAALDAISLDVLQVVASAARVLALRSRFGRPVWRAVAVAAADDLPACAEGADALVLDAAAPPGCAIPGGNAAAFDWALIRGWRAPAPWLLAGGLTPGNVQAAVAQTGATSVDVSSGVERSRGVKDPAKIEAFIRAAHQAV